MAEELKQRTEYIHTNKELTQKTMRRSLEHKSSGSPDRDSTSDDYHSHITKIARAPSVLTGVPKYLNFYKIFNKKTISTEETDSSPQQQQQQKEKHKHPEPEARKKVQFVESKEDRQSNEEGKSEVEEKEKSIDSMANGIKQQSRKNFAIYKWKTFK